MRENRFMTNVATNARTSAIQTTDIWINYWISVCVIFKMRTTHFWYICQLPRSLPRFLCFSFSLAKLDGKKQNQLEYALLHVSVSFLKCKHITFVLKYINNYAYSTRICVWHIKCVCVHFILSILWLSTVKWTACVAGVLLFLGWRTLKMRNLPWAIAIAFRCDKEFHFQKFISATICVWKLPRHSLFHFEKWPINCDCFPFSY